MQATTRLTRAIIATALIATIAGCTGNEPADPASQGKSPSAETQANASQPVNEDGVPADETADQAPSAEAGDAPGLAVGERAPEFELQDQHGESRTLAGLLEQGPVALVFYRSADW